MGEWGGGGLESEENHGVKYHSIRGDAMRGHCGYLKPLSYRV